ncbi:MAG: N-acetyltransferase [Bifidobacteriaceae bacterium]|nr:N-acetyltransferase [Bifidobacteriaceae bacterium]
MTVQDNPAESRYELFDASTLVGFVDYRLKPGHIALTHTEVAPQYEGRGHATDLIRAALDDAKARDLAVFPYCSFVQAFMAEHPAYVSLVPASRRHTFNLA